MDIIKYFQELKEINKEKPHYTVFLSEKKEKEKEKEIIEKEEDDDEDQKDNDIKIQNSEEEKQEEKQEEKESEVSDDISTNSEIKNEDKPIDIEKVYSKRKMYRTNLKEIDTSIFTGNKLDYCFYYYLDLYYNFTYDIMKDLKQNFMNYDILKRYIASKESSITISFNDYDKTIMHQLRSGKNDKDEDCESAKELKKGVKSNIIKNLIIMSKLTRMTRHMNSIFIDYMKTVIYDIIKGCSEIKNKIGEGKKGSDYFLKIGHFMVNFKAYRAGEDTFEAFKEDKLYQMVIKGEQVPIENKDSDKIIIDK